MRFTERKTTLAITMGDAAGIGPEIVVKALNQPNLYDNVRVVVLGNPDIIYAARSAAGLDNIEIATLKTPVEILEMPVGSFGVYDPFKEHLDFTVGEPNANTGKASMAYVEQAAQMVLTGRASAIITAPISKKAIQEGGFLYTGHTDYLAEATNTKKVYMAAFSKKLVSISVTGHVSLRRAHSDIKQARVIRAAMLMDQFLTALHEGKHPQLIVTGFNPHAGEGGLLGREEIFEILPAIQAMQNMNYPISGPIAADVAFNSALEGKFDGVVAMYHDQAMIPVKLISRFESCQISLGLPIIRTSVNHGTAEDIAGKNIADSTSMVEAVRMAYRLINLRHQGYDV